MNREKQEPTDKEELSDGGTKLKNVLANHGTVGSDCLDSGQFPVGKKTNSTFILCTCPQVGGIE